jgi:hypothetical protein
MVAMSCERYCEVRVYSGMGTKVCESAIESRLSATETYSDRSVGIEFVEPRYDAVKSK